ncbi:hypothetical protein JCM10212_005090 [Sporobolomyces blumeae]
MATDDDDFESWDSDPDFALPSTLRLPLRPSSSLSLRSDASEVGPPPPPSSVLETPPKGHDERTTDFFSILDSRLVDADGSTGARGDRDDEENQSSIDSRRTESSTGTLRGLVRDLSINDDEDDDVNFDLDGDRTASRIESIGFDADGRGFDEGEGETSTPKKMQTLRKGSKLSQLLSLASPSTRGKVHHLGSTPRGQAKEVGKGDWDQDLDLDGLESTGDGKLLKVVEKKASWNSHLSIEDDDDEAPSNPPAPTSADLSSSLVVPESSVSARRFSIASFQETDGGDVSDFDFDLPDKQDTFEISPALQARTSIASLRSIQVSTAEGESGKGDPSRRPAPTSTTAPSGSNPTTPFPRKEPSTHLTPPVIASSASPSPNRPRSSHAKLGARYVEPETETEDESDAEFFQDLELPSYFLGGVGEDRPRGGTASTSSPSSEDGSSRDRRRGGGTTTPPTSEPETEDDAFLLSSPSPPKPHTTVSASFDENLEGGKIDLQEILKQKLELRGGRRLLFHGQAGTASVSEGLEKHREKEDEEAAAGKELSLARKDDVSKPPSTQSTNNRATKAEQEEEEEKWDANYMRERMRTISGARAREAAAARSARANGQGGARGQRRTVSMSAGRIPPVPPLPDWSSRSQSAFHPSTLNKRPLGPRRSETTPHASSTTVPGGRVGLTRSGSSTSIASQPASLPSSARSSLPQIVRPASAQAISTPSHSHPPSSSRRGPPPAPSTASRDRVRLRTSSLRTVVSSSDLRTQATGLGGETKGLGQRRPSRLSLDSGSNERNGPSRRGSSPFPVTPGGPSSASASSFPRTAPSPVPTPSSSLRAKRSHQNLRPTPSTPRTIERKRSLQNLSSTSQQDPPRSASRQSLLRSPSPARSFQSLSNRPSFAAPTAASVARIRERVQSNPHPLPVPQTALVPPSPGSTPLLTPTATASASSTARLLQPTLSSASKSRSIAVARSPSKPSLAAHARQPSHPSLTGLRIPSRPLVLSRPTKAEGSSSATSTTTNDAKRSKGDWGDGTELDGFDDLPVSKEREKAFVVAPVRTRGDASSRSTSGSTIRSVSTATVIGGPGSSIRKSSAGTVKSFSLTSTGEESRRISVPRSSNGLMGKKEGDKMREKEREREKGKKKKREPHLIRHLGHATSAVKVQGEMTWNPELQRWEGNESILREFDKVLGTSNRPALISPFSSALGSPSRAAFPLSPNPNAEALNSKIPGQAGSSTRLPASASRAGVKVVGDMVFDPSTCSWHAISGPEAEDELELDWGEIADDEHGAEFGADGGDGWEKGERERMLQNRASFVLSEGDEDESENDDASGKKGKMTRKGIWRESQRAEERCREELGGWARRLGEGEKEDRSWLFELRALIMDSR